MTFVTDHLERAGVRFEVLPHQPARTAVDRARTLGMHPDEVVEVLVLEITTGPAIAVFPASRLLDIELVRAALRDPSARLATEPGIRARFPEFEPGAVPALPIVVHVPAVIDHPVLERRQVTFAAGVQRTSVRVGTELLLHGPTVTIAEISRPTATDDQQVAGATRGPAVTG